MSEGAGEVDDLADDVTKCSSQLSCFFCGCLQPPHSLPATPSLLGGGQGVDRELEGGLASFKGERVGGGGTNLVGRIVV